jgi:hypothetical protein
MLSPHLLDLLREWDDFPRTASRSRTTSRCAAHRPIALGNCRGFSRPRRVPCWLAGAGGFEPLHQQLVSRCLLCCRALRRGQIVHAPAGVDRSPPLPPHGSVAPNGHIRDAKARILPPQPASRGAARQVGRAVRVCGRRNARRANDADGRLRGPETPPYAKAKTMMVSPWAKAIAEIPLSPAPVPTTAAAPAPMNTNAKVPMNSARSLAARWSHDRSQRGDLVAISLA